MIKPINNSNGAPLIGRTILQTYPPVVNDEKRFFLTGESSVSLFGIPFDLKSLPFQAQDMAVSACATIALWISLHTLKEFFGISTSSPFEVTERSVSFPAEHRNFPSSGLNILQIKNYFNVLGLETEIINIGELTKYNVSLANAIIVDAVKAFINTGIGLPIITTLKMKNENGSEAFHAVVISGYRHQNDIIKELYIHDDQIGPYSKVEFDGDAIHWKNEWVKDYGYKEVVVQKLIVPVYPKIRLSFGPIYDVLLKHREMIKGKNKKLHADLYLMQVNEYKKFLLYCSIKDKDKILIEPLPRFLWIIRTHLFGIPILDFIYDGTLVFPTKIKNIHFRPLT